MSRRSTAFAFDQRNSFHDGEMAPSGQMVSERVEQAFPIRWETFQDDLHREHGFVDFLIVDDFTSYNLWDGLLSEGISRLGLRPEGYMTSDGSAMNALPEGKWRMLHAMRSLAADELYARAGVTKPCATTLPAVYCLVHGEPTGACVFNVNLDSAIDFIRGKIGALVPANCDRIVKRR